MANLSVSIAVLELWRAERATFENLTELSNLLLFTGEVGLWRVADRTPLWAVQGHTGGVWDVTLSADGRLLASVQRMGRCGCGRRAPGAAGHAARPHG